jgi:hypothetical protein
MPADHAAPGRLRHDLLLILRWLGIGLLLVLGAVVLLFGFEIVRLLVDPAARA